MKIFSCCRCNKLIYYQMKGVKTTYSNNIIEDRKKRKRLTLKCSDRKKWVNLLERGGELK